MWSKGIERKNASGSPLQLWKVFAFSRRCPRRSKWLCTISSVLTMINLQNKNLTGLLSFEALRWRLGMFVTRTFHAPCMLDHRRISQSSISNILANRNSWPKSVYLLAFSKLVFCSIFILHSSPAPSSCAFQFSKCLIFLLSSVFRIGIIFYK